MNTPENMQIIDSVDVADAMAASAAENGLNGLGGIVRAINPVTGKTILKKNIFVQRGRTFVLEKLFNDEAPSDQYERLGLGRSINLFRIGSGGAPAVDPFSPIAPSPQDTDLSIVEPFRVVDLNDSDTNLTAEEEGIYFQPEQDGNLIKYYAKRFDNTPTWVLNKADNKIYRSIQLSISSKDARDLRINELGLCISTPEHQNIELFSRWTTETIAFTGTMAMKFEYLVYA